MFNLFHFKQRLKGAQRLILCGVTCDTSAAEFGLGTVWINITLTVFMVDFVKDKSICVLIRPSKGFDNWQVL